MLASAQPSQVELGPYHERFVWAKASGDHFGFARRSFKRAGTPLGLYGVGGVFNIRRSTSSSLIWSAVVTMRSLSQNPHAYGDSEFQAAVGRLVLTWAKAEMSIDVLTIGVFHFANASKETELPRSFKRKIRFLTTCFNKHPDLKVWRPTAIALFGEAKTLADVRATMVHGMALQLRDSMADFFRFKYGKVNHDLEKKRFTAADIESAALRNDALYSNLLSLLVLVKDGIEHRRTAETILSAQK